MVCAYFAQFIRTDWTPTAHLKYRKIEKACEIFDIRRREKHWKFLKITKFLKVGSTVYVLEALKNHALFGTGLLNSGRMVVMKYQHVLYYSAIALWLF